MRRCRPTFRVFWCPAGLVFFFFWAPLVWSADVDIDGLLVPPAGPTSAAGTDKDGLVEEPTAQPVVSAMQAESAPSPAFSSIPVSTMPPGVVTPSATIPEEDEEDAKAPALPGLAVFPIPARGINVTFRFQSPEVFQYIVNLYDRFGESIILLNGEGKELVDVVWPLVQVPEGIYYYRILAVHPKTGTIQKFPVGQLVVEKDPEPLRPKKLRRSVVGR